MRWLTCLLIFLDLEGKSVCTDFTANHGYLDKWITRVRTVGILHDGANKYAPRVQRSSLILSMTTRSRLRISTTIWWTTI